MSSVSKASKIEQALCSNHEILSFLPNLFARFEVERERAEEVRRALMLFQSGLLAAVLVPHEVDAATVREMAESHREIAARVALVA